MAGWRPVCEMQYDAFSYPCLDQLITHVGRYHWRTGGKMQFPITIRMPYGGGVRAPELHDDSPEAYYVHTPGIKVAIPSTPADAKGLLAAAIRDPDPVVIFEPKLVYRTARGEVPEGEHVVPLGQARIAREGTDVTLIAYGAMVGVCERAADELDVSCEVVDIRSLRPLDEAAILASVAKTGRVVIVHEAPRTAGFGAELAALIAEKAIFDLQGPVLRVTGYDVPYPYWSIEDHYMPSRRARRRGGPVTAGPCLMAYEFKLPDLGEGLTEGEVARWLVAVGDEIAEDAPLVEIQTDKTTVEIPSPAAGTVLRILVAEGEVAPVGSVLVVIGSEGDAPPRRAPRRRAGRAPDGRDGSRPGDAARAADRPGARRRPRRVAGDRPRRPNHRGRTSRGRGEAPGRGAPREGARRAPPDRRAPDPRAPRGAGRHVRRGVRLQRRRPGAARCRPSCRRRRSRCASSPS